MTLTVELPAETETLLQAIAAREGRDLLSLVLEAANEKAAREKAQQQVAGEEARREKADAALDELTRLTEEMGLYEHQTR